MIRHVHRQLKAYSGPAHPLYTLPLLHRSIPAGHSLSAKVFRGQAKGGCPCEFQRWLGGLRPGSEGLDGSKLSNDQRSNPQFSMSYQG